MCRKWVFMRVACFSLKDLLGLSRRRRSANCCYLVSAASFLPLGHYVLQQAYWALKKTQLGLSIPVMLSLSVAADSCMSVYILTANGLQHLQSAGQLIALQPCISKSVDVPVRDLIKFCSQMSQLFLRIPVFPFLLPDKTFIYLLKRRMGMSNTKQSCVGGYIFRCREEEQVSSKSKCSLSWR